MMGEVGIFDALMKSVSEISIGNEEYQKGEGSVIWIRARGLRR